jgi:hypothetical protein
MVGILGFGVGEVSGRSFAGMSALTGQLFQPGKKNLFLGWTFLGDCEKE